MSGIERTLCAQHFLTYNLTSRERMLVAAFALGYNQLQVANAWSVSPPAVNKMVKRIERKATKFWHS